MAEIMLRKLLNGTFKPVYDSDYELAKKYKTGEDYAAKIRKPRNLKFHKKFFALLGLVLDNMPETKQEQFSTTDHILKAIKWELNMYEIRATASGEAYPEWESIAFHKMDDVEFNSFYEKAVDVICNHFIPITDPDERKGLMAEVANYF